METPRQSTVKIKSLQDQSSRPKDDQPLGVDKFITEVLFSERAKEKISELKGNEIFKLLIYSKLLEVLSVAQGSVEVEVATLAQARAYASLLRETKSRHEVNPAIKSF